MEERGCEYSSESSGVEGQSSTAVETQRGWGLLGDWKTQKEPKDLDPPGGEEV